ncbi:MAG: hypothetical protein ACREUG_18580, partial [Steroidobacteraceae bacterium]
MSLTLCAAPSVDCIKLCSGRRTRMMEFTWSALRLCYDPPMNVVRLVQFTDPHLHGDEAATLRGLATWPAFNEAIAHARSRDWPPDAILVTGDIVQDDP